MPTAVRPIDFVPLAMIESIHSSWRRSLVVYGALPLAAVALSFAVAQIFLVPRLVHADLQDYASYVATTQFLAELKAEFGATAVSSVTQPYFPRPGTLIAFDSDNVQTYEFSSAHEAEIRAGIAMSEEHRLMRRGFLHLYQKGSLLVLYFGNKDSVQKDLESVIGAELSAAR